MDCRSRVIRSRRLGEPQAGSITDHEPVTLEPADRPLESLRIEVRQRLPGGQRRHEAPPRPAVAFLEALALAAPPLRSADRLRPAAPRGDRAGLASRRARRA